MDATQWSVLCGIVGFLAIIVWIDRLSKNPQPPKKEYREWYECPKCNGNEYYMGIRNIVTAKNALGWTRTEDKQVRCCKLDDQQLVKKGEWRELP